MLFKWFSKLMLPLSLSQSSVNRTEPMYNYLICVCTLQVYFYDNTHLFVLEHISTELLKQTISPNVCTTCLYANQYWYSYLPTATTASWSRVWKSFREIKFVIDIRTREPWMMHWVTETTSHKIHKLHKYRDCVYSLPGKCNGLITHSGIFC